MTRNRQLELVLFIGLVAGAVMLEYDSSTEAGQAAYAKARELHAAQLDTRTIDTHACELYAHAMVEGHREAPWYVADCIAQSKDGSEAERRMVQYGVLSLCLETGIEGLTCREKRDALNLTPGEIEVAEKLPVLRLFKQTSGASDAHWH